MKKEMLFSTNTQLDRLNGYKVNSPFSSFVLISTIVLLIWVFFKPANCIFSEFLLLPALVVYLLIIIPAGLSCFFGIRWISINAKSFPEIKNSILWILLFLIIYSGHAIYAYATNRFQHFHWVPLVGISFLVFSLYKKEHFMLFPVYVSLIVLGMGLYESVLAVLQYFLWAYPKFHSNLLLYPHQRVCFMHDGISFIKSVIRPMGTFDSPITLGIFLAGLLPLAVWFFPVNKSPKTIFSLLGIILIALALALTYSRAAAFSAMFILILSSIAYFYLDKNFLSWISLFIAGFLLIWTFGNHWAYVRWKNGIELEDKSVANRVAIWENSKSIVLHHPLLGVGLGNFAKSYEQYNPMPANISDEMQDLYRYTNSNYWLSLACENGVIGSISFFAFMLTLSVIMIKRIKCKDKSIVSLIPYWCTPIILIMAGFSNSSLGHPFLNLWMWVFMGFLLSQLAVESIIQHSN